MDVTSSSNPRTARATASDRQYRAHVWLAMLALALFVTFYLAAIAWFGSRAWILLSSAIAVGARDMFMPLICGVMALLLAVFMAKALFFIKRHPLTDAIEVTERDQPRLFAFIADLAKEVGAPCPRKVYLTRGVDAAVFYDLSVLSFFFPTRKHLQLGLGLVNVLNVSEFKAVIAHELGHFAQRAMAAGRWVYIAQQVASALVHRRDRMDQFLEQFSWSDFRVAWIGWVARIMVWSIRSLADILFRGVLLADRALSREMELQADLVSVSLTGSDALVHALYRLPAAEKAMASTFDFADEIWQCGKYCLDLYALQTRELEVQARLRGTRDFFEPPKVPERDAASHRVFKSTIAEVPRMWLTHPPSHQREINAKVNYIPMPLDERSAWALFDQPEALRERMSRPDHDTSKHEAIATTDALTLYDGQYDSILLEARYRGMYRREYFARFADQVDDTIDHAAQGTPEELAALYPPSLIELRDQLSRLRQDGAELEEIRRGQRQLPDGVIRYRDRVIKRRELPELLTQLRQEHEAIESRLNAHEKHVRGAHAAAARRLGRGWQAYHHGLIELLHYAEHMVAVVGDAREHYDQCLRLALMTGTVHELRLSRVINAATALRRAMLALHTQFPLLQVPEAVSERLRVRGWTDTLGELKLPDASRQNIEPWIQALNGWFAPVWTYLNVLRMGTAEVLLRTEALIAEATRAGTDPGDAPETTRLTVEFPRLPPPEQRQRDYRLDWWTRFRLADGWVPGLARSLIAGVICLIVYQAGNAIGDGELSVFNGLDMPVTITVNHDTLTLPAFGSRTMSMPPGRVNLDTRASDGRIIEQLQMRTDFDRPYALYNVAGATVLVQWNSVGATEDTAPLGDVGASHWNVSPRRLMFHEKGQAPPADVVGEIRLVEALSPRQPYWLAQTMAPSDAFLAVAETHAHWDPTTSPGLAGWFKLLDTATIERLVRARLNESPDDVVLRRLQHDLFGDPAAICAEHAEQGAQHPDSVDWRYLVSRCLPDPEARDHAMLSGHAAHPEHPWFALEAADIAFRQQRAHEALALLQAIERESPQARESACESRTRIERLVVGMAPVDDQALANCPPLGTFVGMANDDVEVARLAGRPLEALEMALKNSEARHDQLLWLIAASDGVGRELGLRALQRHVIAGADERGVASAVGLALANAQDPGPYLLVMQGLWGRHAARARALVAALRLRDVANAEKAMSGLPPKLLGQASVIGAVALREAAPARWRAQAERLLFEVERPTWHQSQTP